MTKRVFVLLSLIFIPQPAAAGGPYSMCFMRALEENAEHVYEFERELETQWNMSSSQSAFMSMAELGPALEMFGVRVPFQAPTLVPDCGIRLLEPWPGQVVTGDLKLVVTNLFGLTSTNSETVEFIVTCWGNNGSEHDTVPWRDFALAESGVLEARLPALYKPDEFWVVDRCRVRVWGSAGFCDTEAADE